MNIYSDAVSTTDLCSACTGFYYYNNVFANV